MNHESVNTALIAEVERLAGELSPAIPVARGNRNFTPPVGAPWLRAIYSPVDATKASIGKRARVDVDADLLIGIYLPRDRDESEALRTADSLTNSLEATDLQTAGGGTVRVGEAALRRTGINADAVQYTRWELRLAVQFSRRSGASA